VQREPQIAVRLRETRLEVDRPAVRRASLLEAGLRLERSSQIEPPVGEPGMSLHQVPEHHFGLRWASQHAETASHAELNFRVRRVESRGALESRESLLHPVRSTEGVREIGLIDGMARPEGSRLLQQVDCRWMFGFLEGDDSQQMERLGMPGCEPQRLLAIEPGIRQRALLKLPQRGLQERVRLSVLPGHQNSVGLLMKTFHRSRCAGPGSARQARVPSRHPSTGDIW
jgi:hypothetical protein